MACFFLCHLYYSTIMDTRTYTDRLESGFAMLPERGADAVRFQSEDSLFLPTEEELEILAGEIQPAPTGEGEADLSTFEIDF